MKQFAPWLTADENIKGVLDIDTVKGCELGVKAHGPKGCYGLCYAAAIATGRGFDFGRSVSRKIDYSQAGKVEKTVAGHGESWFRVGTMGDPSHDWPLTVNVCEWLSPFKQPVVVTKHWRVAKDSELARLAKCGAVINTSVSALDTPDEIAHRLVELNRAKDAGLTSVLRVVTARFNQNMPDGKKLHRTQDWLLSIMPNIDTPLRVFKNDPRAASGLLQTCQHSNLGKLKTISLHNPKAYIGHCSMCPDKCGAKPMKNQAKQIEMLQPKAEFIYLKTVIGSGYEKLIAKLAIEDGIAERAARKNMQIHSAIVLKIDGEFAGFFTFQNNAEVGEFCLLQSVIKPSLYTDDLYRQMAVAVLEQNKANLPAIITTDPKSTFETPELFESLGFVTYLKMSGFHYMVKGPLDAVRMKQLAHITMTNVWITTKGDWLRLKREWNDRITKAGERENIKNPGFATRDGCWQGDSGYSEVVNTRRHIGDNGEIVETTKAHNGNASVLDPVACEVIARFFMPKGGGKIYNPFGGGVQMGFVAGACGYEYQATEIRQNQCDANNKLCSEFDGVYWTCFDSSKYVPAKEHDLVFTCPPYYKVEEYLDYDGQPPEGEINSAPTYEQFRELLFSGYEKALTKLKQNRFFVVMTGDSRGKDGGYYCHEAETVIFFKDRGLKVYNQIVFVECEFTRLAHAKKTLNYRKFPKREQKIIVAYKGDTSQIQKFFPAIGRL